MRGTRAEASLWTYILKYIVPKIDFELRYRAECDYLVFKDREDQRLVRTADSELPSEHRSQRRCVSSLTLGEQQRSDLSAPQRFCTLSTMSSYSGFGSDYDRVRFITVYGN